MAYGLEGAPQNQQDIPLSPDETKQWWARIELDRQRRKRESDKWRGYLQNYLPPENQGTSVNSNLHFRNTEQKKALLWARLPELILTPREPLSGLIDPQTGQPADGDTIADLKRAVLAEKLDEANADLMVNEALFDVFQTSGIGWTKICYQSDVAYPPSDAPTTPTPQPGAILQLGTPPVPAPQPVVVNERWRWYRFSAEKGLLPSDFHSTNFDEAPYLAMEFIEPLTEQARRGYNLPPDFTGTVSRDEMLSTSERDRALEGTGKKSLIKGVEIWLYACYFDPTVANSQVMRRLVLIEGLKDRPAIYRNSPYQTIQPDGRLSKDSLIGNPLHPLVLRVASDTAYVPPDAAFTDPLVRIKNTDMNRDIKRKDANIPRFVHPVSASQAIDRLKNMDTGQGVAVPDDVYMRFPTIIKEIPHLTEAQSDVAADQEIDRAIQETLGIGANQAGAYNRTVHSATEVATVQANVSARQKKEQSDLLRWFLRGVQKFDALLQQFLTQPGYVDLVGQDGARVLTAYTNAHLRGSYAYDAHPDSQLTMDVATLRKEFTDFVNFMAKSGWIDLGFVARRGALLFGFNPSRTVRAPQPPPPPPPPHPNVSLALKAADLAIPEVHIVLQQLGIQLPNAPSPELTIALAQERAKQQPHGGAANKADLVEKHQAAITGQQPGAPPIASVPQQPQIPPVSAQMVQ